MRAWRSGSPPKSRSAITSYAASRASWRALRWWSWSAAGPAGRAQHRRAAARGGHRAPAAPRPRGDPATQLDDTAVGRDVVDLFGRRPPSSERIHPARLHASQLAIDLLVAGRPEEPDRGVEAPREIQARGGPLDERGEQGVRQGHEGVWRAPPFFCNWLHKPPGLSTVVAMTAYPHLLAPPRPGLHDTPNRVLMGSMHVGLEEAPDGFGGWRPSMPNAPAAASAPS